MKVIIDIPNDFTGDYIADKFKDFFSRVIADVDCKGMCGRYEKEIAEMFLKAFDNSEEKISCNCQHDSNSRDNEPCCRCDSKQTNADRIRNMSDEELASWYVIKCEIMMGIKCQKPYKTCKDCKGCKYEKSTNIKELLAFCIHCKRAYSHEEDREIHEDMYEETE